jgi:PUA domain protein
VNRVAEIHVRKRHRLRQKEIMAISTELNSLLGATTFSVSDTVDMAETQEFDVVFVNGKILAFKPGAFFLTVRGLLAYGATKRFVTVDMGAVKFVYNGADVMTPGIVGHDPEIKEGDLVWVRDVKNLRPLAIGRALIGAGAIALKEKGKAIESVHHVGDKLWLLDEPKEKEEQPGEGADNESG